MIAIVTNWFKPSECLPAANVTILFISEGYTMVGMYISALDQFVESSGDGWPFPSNEVDWWAVLTTP